MALAVASTAPHSPAVLEAERLEQKRLWQRLRGWFKDDDLPCPDPDRDPDAADLASKPAGLTRRLSKKVGQALPMVSLPRPATFRRQNSERRERLTAAPRVAPRPVSVDRRRRAASARPASPRAVDRFQLSAPAVCASVDGSDSSRLWPDAADGGAERTRLPPSPRPDPPRDPPPDAASDASLDDDRLAEQIRAELEERWILNLSMHFRDKSPREKFFVTYAEAPARWRRVTVSCDYRDSPPDSLERDLQALPYQREKSARIYEAIRMSLPDIQFYDTVTNLKLETGPDGRLHVHVTEDANEIIPYPSTQAVAHLDYRRVPESEVNFESHMSGFVYKVRVDGQVWIKKEIPGPDSVEEFLYEINALHALMGAHHVIRFQGLVVDGRDELVKGLLIGYAELGPLVDLIFDYRPDLEWARRERWARQIVHGLSEIHEAGFVQGDFTLSNIVVDEHDRAQIIDINRRGCPVGWEPPEIARLIESGQRIAMYIGVKSDLFQLGMVLWALAEEEDEPERQARPLSLRETRKNVPAYYRELTDVCLSPNPAHRLSARALLDRFPAPSAEPADGRPTHADPARAHGPANPAHSRSDPSETRYIDPAQAVEREDLALHGRHPVSQEFSSPSHTYIDRRDSVDPLLDGPGSYVVSRRGRLGPAEPAHPDAPLDLGPRHPSPAGSDRSPRIAAAASDDARRWERVGADGERYTVQQEPSDPDELDELAHAYHHRMRHVQRIGTGLEEMRVLGMEHVDSGLGPDIDLGELVGVGGNDALVLGEHVKYDASLEMHDGPPPPDPAILEPSPHPEPPAGESSTPRGSGAHEGSKLHEPLDPETWKPEISSPETWKTETWKPEIPEPATLKPETSKPEISKPETSKPEPSKPDTSKPETSKLREEWAASAADAQEGALTQDAQGADAASAALDTIRNR